MDLLEHQRVQMRDLFSHAASQTNAFLNAKRNNKEFIDARFVTRDVEKDIRRFIEQSDATGCILIGRPGMGKTHIVCQQADQYLRAGYPVLVYKRELEVGAQSNDPATDIGRRIATNLGLRSDIPLIDQLERLSGTQAEQGKLLIFVDGIETPFSSNSQVGPEDVLRAWDKLIRAGAERRLPIKVLITCVTTVWNLFPSQDAVHWPYYFSDSVARPLVVDRFNNRESLEAYQRYLGLIPDQDKNQVENIDRICEGDPFVLKLISEPELRAEALSGKLSITKVFECYYRNRILGRGHGIEKERFLNSFVKLLLEEGVEYIPNTKIPRLDKVGYETLRDEGILLVDQLQGMVRLHHTRLTEYLIGGYLDREYPRGRMSPKAMDRLIDSATPGFHALREALANYIARWGTTRTFTRLARSDNYYYQQVALEALEIAGRTVARVGSVSGLAKLGRSERADGRTRSEQDIQSILRSLLQDRTRQSKGIALRAAVRLHRMVSVQREMLRWISKDPTAAADHVYLSWREVKETRLGDGIWEEVDRFVDDVWMQKSAKPPDSHSDGIAPSMGWLIQKAKQIEERLGLGRKAVVNFMLSFTWRVLINEFHDDIMLARTSKTWSRILRPAEESAWLSTLLQGAKEKALPKITQKRVRDFIQNLLPSRPPYFPSMTRNLITLLDPEVDITGVEQEDVVFQLLQARSIAPVALASLALSLHTHEDVAKMTPFLRHLFERSTPPRQLAILAGFALHAEHAVKDELISLLGELTRDLLRAQPEYLTKPQDPFGRLEQYKLPFVLAPLGLAWCNGRQHRTPFIEPIVTLINELGWRKNQEQLRGVIDSLVPIGIYFPEAALHTLNELGITREPTLKASLCKALGIIQAFNYERVYYFLRDQRLDIRPDPLDQANFDKLLNFFTWLSMLNFMYYTLHKKHLRAFWVGALEALSDPLQPQQLQKIVQRFSNALLDLAERENFDLLHILKSSSTDPEAIIRKIVGSRDVPQNP